MVTVGPFEKHPYHHQPYPSLDSNVVTEQRKVTGDNRSNRTLCRSHASPSEQLTNHSGACWVGLGSLDFLQHNECNETQETIHIQLWPHLLSGGAHQFTATGGNITPSPKDLSLPLTHTHACAHTQRPNILGTHNRQEETHTHQPCKDMASHSFT